MNDFVNDYILDREAWNSQTEENAARGAWAWAFAHSKGWGEVVIGDSIMFGLTFVVMPTVSYSFILDDDDQLVDGRFPRCSGGVVRWIRDAHDYYIGAHVMITVATADPIMTGQSLDIITEFGVDPGYDITHSFTFNALAIKDVVEG